MSIKTVNRGTAVTIELEYKKRVPFGSPVYFDPATTPTVTIKDEHGTAVVDAQDATKSDVGKWYYFCQTDVAWHPGDYTVETSPTDGTYTGKEITDPAEDKGFRLV